MARYKLDFYYIFVGCFSGEATRGANGHIKNNNINKAKISKIKLDIL